MHSGCPEGGMSPPIWFTIFAMVHGKLVRVSGASETQSNLMRSNGISGKLKTRKPLLPEICPPLITVRMEVS